MRHIAPGLIALLFISCADGQSGQMPLSDTLIHSTISDAQPSLRVVYTGPKAFTAHTKQAVTLFCFTLEAVGADLEVTLPVMQIIAIDGGRVQTNSPDDSRVFQNPTFTKNGVVVVDNWKTPINVDMTVAGMDFASITPLLVQEGDTDEYCLHARIVFWSLTPSDYSGHVYHVVMPGWSEGVVQIVSTDTALNPEPVQVIPPSEIVGNPITIKSSDDDPAYYTGAVSVVVAADTPTGSFAEAGKHFVPVLHLIFSATGNGGCIRGIDFVRTGIATDSDFRSAQLWYDTTLKSPLYTAAFNDGAVTMGWHAVGVLFCIEAGVQLSLTLSVHPEPTATIGATFSLNVEQASDFDRPNDLMVEGAFPLQGGVVQIIQSF